MVLATSPRTPADLAQATWDDVAPFYQELAERPLTAATVESWLAEWSRLESLLAEAAALAMIAYTCDTADPAKESAHLRFSGDILPRMDEQGVRLAERLLALGYTRPGLELMLRQFREQSEIFRQENVPLMAEIEQHSAHYQKLTGGLTVEWDGREVTIPQLQPILRSPERAVRERAFRAATGAYAQRRDELADVFDALFAIRTRVATNAGLANYEEYAFRSKCRFDYTPADCRRFHAAVEEVVAPAVARLLERRRRRLGITSVRPWDLAADPDHREPVTPFRTAAELTAKSARIFQEVDPTFGHEFRLMMEEQLLDLETRKGKAPGGYCETLPHRGRPFIFMNAVGIVDDVSTLLHEAGHAFHAFAAHSQPLIWQRHPGLEMCELASMAMELLAAPYLGVNRGGFFEPEDLARARIEHLEDALISLAHIASVDAFQSWMYTSGEGHDRDARDAAWLRIRGRFETGVDWSGLERERVARWYRQLHIFLYPFYYIEYGIAQIGALEVWRNSLRNQPDAVRRYRDALALGATRSLPELFSTAGTTFSFDPRHLGGLVALVEEQLAWWECHLARPAPGLGAS